MSKQAQLNRVYCRICGRRVRSKVGAVCSRRRCHEEYLAKSEEYGW